VVELAAAWPKELAEQSKANLRIKLPRLHCYRVRGDFKRLQGILHGSPSPQRQFERFLNTTDYQSGSVTVSLLPSSGSISASGRFDIPKRQTLQ
jgi:hypothetical protein